MIHNPVSGTGDAERHLEQIRKVFRERGEELRVTLTTEDAQVAERIENGAAGVIASGGDGTVMEVAGALAGTATPLGVIPRGTANAFALALGLPLGIAEACEGILAGRTRTVDLVRCNSRTMVLLAAIGFEAELVRAADRETKQRLGPLAYLFGGVAQFAQQQPFAARLEVGGQVLDTEAVAVSVANAAPPTSVLAQGLGGPKPDDGLLDVTVVSAEDKLEALTAFARLVQAGLAETEVDAENVRSFRAPSVRVTTDPPQRVAVDGELLERTPVEFECLPEALRVFAA